jgi:hypothetical protein
MEPSSARRWRGRLLAPVAVSLCAAFALLAGVLPASAAQPTAPQPALTVSMTFGHEAAQSAQSAQSALPPDLSVRCSPGINKFNRTNLCWQDTLSFTFLENEEPVGESIVILYQYIALRPKLKTFTEYDTVGPVTSTGTTAPIEAVLTAACGSDCVATGGLRGTLKPGLTGTISYSSNLPRDDEFTRASDYTLDYDAPPYIPLDVGHWDTPIDYRCDNSKAINNTTGCVFEEFDPTLVLSLKTGGASAAMVAWAMVHMHEHWGWNGHGKPLSRLQNDTTADHNRDKVCDSTFHRIAGIGAPARGTKHPWTDTDSCDEFPFAATYESGATSISSGAACVQLKAVRTSSSTTADEAAQWGGVTTVGKVNLKASCVRGHIPNRLNGVVGSAYSGLISSARLANGDEFWIAFD